MRNFHFLKLLLPFVLISAFVLPFFGYFSQALAQSECQSREECENLLKKYEEEIGQLEKDISKTQQEKNTLQNQISILKKTIEKLKLQIQQSNTIIGDITIQIKDTGSSIEKTTLKIEDLRGNLAGILKLIYQEDQKSLIEILISSDKISEFFSSLSALEDLNSKSRQLISDIRELKVSLEGQKQSLDEEKEDLERISKIQALQKQESETTRKEREQILKMTETQYQKYLKEKKELEERAAEIMARIAQLTLPGLDVPTTKKELYELASWAGNLTGVRPALILGLIEVESALGTNVGQCNCAGQSYCRHPNISYKQVMSSAQWDAFLQITRELGLDPNATPVSCAVSGGMVQMGGAMGPAQFMPNTWVKYKTKIESKTGIVLANPWSAKDAFLAAALYLSDWNANTQLRVNEISAVTAYLCGTNIMTARCQRAGGVWYRNSVMEKADKWQEWISQGIAN